MPTPSLPLHADKRRAVRGRQLRRARCIFNGGSSSLDVIVRDLSPKGAKIAGDALICLPPTFELRIFDSYGDFAIRNARLVWCKAASAGVEFFD